MNRLTLFRRSVMAAATTTFQSGTYAAAPVNFAVTAAPGVTCQIKVLYDDKPNSEVSGGWLPAVVGNTATRSFTPDAKYKSGRVYFRPMRGDQPQGDFSFKFTIGEAPRPTPTPTTPTPTSGNTPAGLEWSLGIGACTDCGTAYLPQYQTLAGLGVKLFRCCVAVDLNHDWWSGGLKGILAAVPGSRFLLTFMQPEGPGSAPGTGPWSDDQIKAVAAHIKQGLAGVDRSRIAIGALNEFNARHYIDFGLGTTVQPNDPRPAYAVKVYQAFTEAMPDVDRVAPPVGWLDDNLPAHVEWAAALKAAGMTSLVKAWDTHLYNANAVALAAYFPSMRNVIGTMPWWHSETNCRGGDRTLLIKALRYAGTLPILYRGYERLNRPTDVTYGGCVLDTAGKVNPQVASAWGVKAAA